jgi:hypothetical protein
MTNQDDSYISCNIIACQCHPLNGTMTSESVSLSVYILSCNCICLSSCLCVCLTGTWLAYIRCIRFVVDVRCLLFVVYLCVNLVQNHCRRVVALTLVGTRTQNLQIRSLARYPLRHKSTGRCRGHDVKTLKIRDSGGNLIIHTFEYCSVQISKMKNARLI